MRVLIAAGLTALFVALREILSPVMGLTFGFSLLLPAVLLSSLVGGLSTAILCSACCTVAMALLAPRLLDQDVPLLPPTIAFWLVGMICALVGVSLRHSLQRLHATHDELTRTTDQHRNTANEMRAMVEQASAGIIRTDMDGKIVWANGRFCEILDRERGDIVGHTVTEFTHPEDLHLSHEAISVLNSGQSGWHMEKRYLRPSGEAMITFVSIRALHHANDDKPYGLLSVVIDMSPIRKLEKALSESRHSFRVIADSIGVLIWLTSDRPQDSLHVQKGDHFVNRAYLEFTGHTGSNVTPTSWIDLIHPDDKERVIEAFSAGTTSGHAFSIEARYRRHDGQWRWLKSFHQPRRDREGRKIGVVGTAFDITETREAADRIEESEARFRTVANSAPAMIWMVDDQGRTVFGNRRFRSVFMGKTPARLTTAWREMTHPADRDQLDKILTDARENERRFSILGRIQHPLFGERWIRTEAAPRHDSHGMLIGYTGVSLDVTESQRAERDLKRINELLEERVSAALAEKAKAEAELVRANRLEAVGRLTGGVAHDFNNLLTVIMGGLDIILRSDDPERRRKIGEAALAAARRGERLTSQLLAFSRRQNLTPSQIDLNALIREGEPLLHKAVENTLSLTYKLSEGPAPAMVDSSKFESALINLLVNARDATSTDGEVIVETARYILPENPTAPLSPPAPNDLPPGDYVRVSVIDNGSGMTEEVQRRVFEPFFTTKGVGHGTGLGLSQVYGFTRQSGGSISIESETGKGTRIHMFLPWNSEAFNADTREDPCRERPVQTPSDRKRLMRLLLVEDDHEVATIVTSLIHAEGLQVDRVENAEQALTRLESHSYDVVISDILMPGGISGVELARRLAVSKPDLRVILSSGYAGEVEALRDSQWTLLPKPYTVQQLRAVLDTL